MIVYLLVKLTFLTSFMACLTQFKYSTKKTILSIALFIVLIWSANLPIYLICGYNLFNYLYPVTVALPAFLCFYFLSKNRVYRVLFSFFTVCNFGMLISYFGILFSFLFQNYSINMILEFLCFVGLIVFILKVFRKPYFKVLNTLHAGWWLLCAVPSLLTLILYSLLYYPTPIYDRPENIILVFLVFALMVVFYLTVYLNFENITEYYQLKQDKEFLQMQIGLHKKEYDSIVE